MPWENKSAGSNTCSNATLFTINPIQSSLGLNPGKSVVLRPVTDYLNHGTAHQYSHQINFTL